ncbi:hypothetical protein PTI98_009619 [Pleurotus ostreatus]|nr:hypothetical protein PTI98_009619 [Pleurotus ostreatus]
MKFSFAIIAAVLCVSQSIALPTGYEGQLYKRTKPKVVTTTVTEGCGCPPTSIPVLNTIPPATSSVPPPATSTVPPPVTSYVPPPASTHVPPPPPPATTHVPPPPANQCPEPSKSVFLLRGFKSHGMDHFYTTNVEEMNNAVSKLSFKKESHAAKVYTHPEVNTIPLHRVFNGHANDHFYTTSSYERDNAIHKLGYKDEGVAAHIFATQICGSVPLHRLYNEHGKNHFYTISESEAATAAHNGYTREGVAGFVLPPH